MPDPLRSNISGSPDLSPIPIIDGIPELPSVVGIDDSVARELGEVTTRFGIGLADIARYVDPQERLTGFGKGGSESLVLFVKKLGAGRLARKICSQAFCTVDWDPEGTGVMSPPAAKANLQVQYLQGLPEPVRPYFPEVRDVRESTVPIKRDGKRGMAHELRYDLSLIEGIEISSFVAQHRPTPGVVARLHHEVLRCLADKVHPYRRTENDGQTIEESYLDKITDRLAMCERALPEIFKPLVTSNSIVINGERYRNIRELLAFFNRPEVGKVLEPRYHSLVMGDSNTENVMITKPGALLEAAKAGDRGFTYDDLGITFLDPRSIGYRSQGGDTKDDRMYDNKPVHNTLGHYDVIHGEHFQLKFALANGAPVVTLKADDGNPFEASYRDMGKHFGYIMDGWDVNGEQFQEDDPNWLLRFTFMMGTHFAAMPPFHFTKSPDGSVAQDPEAQKRAIALYCQGIKWLNRAHDMITGDQQELYGVPVPKVELERRPGMRIYKTGVSHARVSRI